MIVLRPDRVPAVDAVDRHVHGVTLGSSRSWRSSSRTVIESSTTRIRLGDFRAFATEAAWAGPAASLSRLPPSRLSIDRTRSSTSTIRTGQPSSRTEAAVDVGRLAQAGVERPDLEVALAEEGVDDQAEPRSPGRPPPPPTSGRAPRPTRGSSEHLRGVDQADELAVDQEVGPPFEPCRTSDLAVDPGDPLQAVEREGVGLARDRDQ